MTYDVDRTVRPPPIDDKEGREIWKHILRGNVVYVGNSEPAIMGQRVKCVVGHVGRHNLTGHAGHGHQFYNATLPTLPNTELKPPTEVPQFG